MKSEIMAFISHYSFVEVSEYLSLAFFVGTFLRFVVVYKISFICEIIAAQYHVLRRNSDSAAVDRFQQVVGGKHEEPRLCLRLRRKRNVNRHLVSVKVRVKRSTYERMKLYGSSFDKHWLKCLN
ncbi:hypothetical protein SDC9_85236 [bioreactor metagenome]|uniref:Uncharacterized protein n=1 Tax=bioreactor metagenome TaxID=1076179 RepID=A0A644ZD39_9ZZZZ